MKRVTRIGLALIKKWESLKLEAYICPAGKLTIGYGHVILEGEHITSPITEKMADDILIIDCMVAEDAINKYVKVPITINQFDALVSLIFNIGRSAFKRSKALGYLNNGLFNEAAMEFFSKERGFVFIKDKVSKGLLNRRQDELKLWSM